MKQAKLPGVMNLSKGTFNATPAKLMVSNANVTLLDASVTVEGFLTNFNQAPLSSGSDRNRDHRRPDGRMAEPAN